MSDQGFDFSPPPPRRECKKFEPPPWEAHRIDGPPRRQNGQEGVSLEPVGTQEEQAAVKIPENRTTMDPNASYTPRPQGSTLDEDNLTAMLFELKAEDPTAGRGFNRIGLAAGLFLLALGVLFVIWGTVMIAIAFRAGQGAVGVLIGSMVLVVGTGITGTGAWLVFRTLRQQGVL